jgi:hypothetical protein
MKLAIECMLEKGHVRGAARAEQRMYSNPLLDKAREVASGHEDKFYAMQPMWSDSAGRLQGLLELWRQTGRK